MKTRMILIVAISIMSVSSATTLACEAAGPATHVGNILKVDSDKNTFTILDAQSVSPVKFQATTDIMEKVISASGTAFVDYEVDGSNLVAASVLFK
jgi:hypothetical protein